ncbi:RHS repeat-associated protein [Thermosporothrix hazakensis]|uniref:RHS repeat-associated protein n=1 Tax=Thermosporothrix hazakensis TaxID=644383 RepID=A0A326U4W7_THEHA|nr:RHS repeat-associated core domain-containing protein [Thermosporothrix hazakensis]PZW20544.1 RHS repeat-associated protein [Thermosporothrix hazakensis]GCE51470.1 type IV secretion protein Rhs [Thermosporothrix hazakensis]
MQDNDTSSPASERMSSLRSLRLPSGTLHWGLRVILALFLCTLAVLADWALLTVPTASAAQQARETATHQTQSIGAPTRQAPAAPQQPTAKGPTKLPPRPAAVEKLSAAQPFDGFGDLSFYTFNTLTLNNRMELKVNVANGNLLVHTSDLHVRGTGLDATLESSYNSQANELRDHGVNWIFSFGHDISLYSENPEQGIYYRGPSGVGAFFAYDSTKKAYTDPPALDATLTKNADGSYTLSFHHTGGKLQFDAGGRLTSMVDKNGNTISSQYDPNEWGNLVSLTDTQQRVFRFEHNEQHGETDTATQIVKLTDPAGRTVTYEYSSGTPTLQQKARAAGVSSSVWLTAITDAEGQTTRFGYEGLLLTSITDPRGNTTRIEYTGDKVLKVIDANGNFFKYEYGDLQTTLTDQNGHQTVYTYNEQLQVTKTTDALGHSTSKAYDANSYNVTSYGDALSNFTTFQFAPGTNNLLSVTQGANGQGQNGVTTTFGYPSGGGQSQYYPLTQTDPQGNVITYTYDANGNVTSAKDKASNIGLTFEYNSNGTVKSQTDANGNKTSFEYDSKGNLIKMIPPSPLGAYTLTVDLLTSRVQCVTDAKQQQTCYSYNKLDQVTGITYKKSDGTLAATISYSYDANGNLTKVVDPTGTTTFSYDKLNRLVSKTVPGGETITTGYDPIGNLTSYEDPGGTVTYTYNEVNLVTSVTEPGGLRTVYGYDNANRQTYIHYPNGTGMSMSYDGAGRMVNIVGGQMDGSHTITKIYTSYRYTYTMGNKNTGLVQTMTLANGNQHRYSYDSLNRLLADKIFTSQNSQVDEFSYTYDAGGNITKAQFHLPNSSGSFTNLFSYGAGNQLLNWTRQGADGSKQTTTFSYDANGNLTEEKGGVNRIFSYNALNQTTQINSTPFTYSGPTQETRVQVADTTYLYNSWGVGKEYRQSGPVTYTRCSCGKLIGARFSSDNSHHYYLFDGLGSIVGVTGEDGSLENSYAYSPYGETIKEQRSEKVYNPWKFAGGSFESETGLYKFGIRYYDPQLGRWTQQDPVGGSLGNLNSANRYLYVGGNPVNATDPTGAFAAGNCVITGILNSISIYLEDIGIFTLMGAFASAIGGPGVVAGALVALGPEGLAFAALAVTIVFALAVFFAAYQIANSASDIKEACS